jgi:predicted regulator of Ras-like GTPase activity (Roadblock/LC7/MglB family)
MFAQRARQLHEVLMAVLVRVRDIRGLVLVDPDGLVLVSTLDSRALEESLGAFAAAVLPALHRARQDFEMGPLQLGHVAARDRQIFITPVTEEIALLAVADSGATSATIALHLLSLTREILGVVTRPAEGSEA